MYREKTFINGNFKIEWNYKHPVVYRFLNNDIYVNNFFSKGELFISCLDDFKKHPNESLRDESEGTFMIAGSNEKGLTGYFIESGKNAFVMSTAAYITEKLKADYKDATVAIKITNPTMFALEIARKLPFVTSGVEGFCNYKESKVQLLGNASRENSILQAHLLKNDVESHTLLTQISEGDEVFDKNIRIKDENEYRLIWFSNERVAESVIISCPEAIQYCEKLVL